MPVPTYVEGQCDEIEFLEDYLVFYTQNVHLLFMHLSSNRKSGDANGQFCHYMRSELSVRFPYLA